MYLNRKLFIAVILFPIIALAGATYTPVVQVAPGPGLPPEVVCMDGNNNLDIARFDGKLFLGFRTAPHHFATKKTKLYIVSSEDGKTWDFETEIYIRADMREPRFLVLGDKLMFYYFEAGKNPMAFSPRKVWAMERKGPGEWTEPVEVLGAGCVLWRAKVRNGVAYVSAYCGGESMYKFGN